MRCVASRLVPSLLTLPMHIFLYEWVTGGGLVEELGSLPESMLAEGTAMVSALAADFAAIDDCRVTVLRDIRLDIISLPGLSLPECEILDIHSASQHEDEIGRLADQSDYTLLIAPEFDDLLLTTARLVAKQSGRLLSAGEGLVELASDKQRTAERLAAAGVPVPVSVRLDADQEKLPRDFSYPAVLKPIHGAGSQHTLLVAGASDEPPPYPWPRRLEQYYPGVPTSVAFLCGPTGFRALPPCRQHLSGDGRFTYTGGSLIEERALAERATGLARLAIDALPDPHGYVGVDLVLGKAADGSEDVVIEINPRVTTSYVGLRAAAEGNLAQAMIDVAEGCEATLSFRDGPLEFTADGQVMHLTGDSSNRG